MKPGERRDLYSSNQVLYVYHDTIDATGDSAEVGAPHLHCGAEAIGSVQWI